MERLYRFSNQLLMEEDLQEVARHAPEVVASIFSFDAVILYLRETDMAYSSNPGNAFVSLEDLRKAARLPDGPRARGGGVSVVPLVLGMRASGSIAMAEVAERGKGRFSDGLYDAIGSLLAVALERATAIDRFSRMEDRVPASAYGARCWIRSRMSCAPH